MFYDPKFAASLSGALSSQLLAYLQQAVCQQQQLQLQAAYQLSMKAAADDDDYVEPTIVKQEQHSRNDATPNAKPVNAVSNNKQLPLDLSLNSSPTIAASTALTCDLNKHFSSSNNSEYSISTTTSHVLAVDNKPTSTTTTTTNACNGDNNGVSACKRRDRNCAAAAAAIRVVQQQTLIAAAINGGKQNNIIEAAATTKDILNAHKKAVKQATKRTKLSSSNKRVVKLEGGNNSSSSFKQLKKLLAFDSATSGKNCSPNRHLANTNHEQQLNRDDYYRRLDNVFVSGAGDDDADDSKSVCVAGALLESRPSTAHRAPRKNQKSRAHACTSCSRIFSRSDMLTRHLRLHSGEKPYECAVCKQAFSRSDHLATHERTHTGVKPYQCDYCAYSACRRDMITRHMRTHLSIRRTNKQLSSSSLNCISQQQPHQVASSVNDATHTSNSLID